MRSKGWILGLLLALVAAIGIFAIAAAAQKPMTGKIMLIGGAADSTRCGPNAFAIDAPGTGTLAHLGTVDIDARNCSSYGNDEGAAEISDGEATFTAADGSTVEITYEGSQEAPVNDVAEYTVTATVVGGTGRFWRAGGAWEMTGTIDFTTGTLVGDVSGWLRF